MTREEIGKLFEILHELESKPLLISILAAYLAYAGWRQLSIINAFGTLDSAGATAQFNSVASTDESARFFRLEKRRVSLKKTLGITISIFTVFALVFLMTTSIEVSASFSIVSTVIPFMLAKNREIRRKKREDAAWPQAIDHIISSLHAGQSITESLIGLNHHGPIELRDSFRRISARLYREEGLEEILEDEMRLLDGSISDEVFTALIFAKEYGGRDVTNTLRLLSTFLRDDAHVREEIDTRFGWVKNSAFLGAAAPWLLLALLSLQPSTRDAYATPAGRLVLVVAILATGIAFLWMERMAQLPESARPLKQYSTAEDGNAYVRSVQAHDSEELSATGRVRNNGQ